MIAIKNAFNIFSFLVLLLAFLIITQDATPTFASQANFPLEITNIKPAGTGDPVLPATNRIFKAYPGIAYNIRAGVIGGVYPYSYALSNAPEGMTIDSFTGEINWPNPQSNAGPITLSVTDSAATTVSTSWSITVTTDGFLFVDGTYVGTSTGSITQPFKSLHEMWDNTSFANEHDVLYIRGGTYVLQERGNPNTFFIGGYGHFQRPISWIGYPGETVNIDVNELVLRSNRWWFDSLNLYNGHKFMLSLYGSGDMSYTTIRRCNFLGMTGGDYTLSNYDTNQGYIYGARSHAVIQDNVFTNQTDAQAVGSMYHTTKMLVENNYFYDGGTYSVNWAATPIGFKANNHRYTVRGNTIIIPPTARYYELYNQNYMDGDQDAEICFNLIVRLPGGSTTTMYVFPHVIEVSLYRNTFVGIINFKNDYPVYFDNNVVVGSIVDKETVVHGDNLVQEENILDENYNLDEGHSVHLGTHGWQLKDGSTPIVPRGFKPPSGLRIIVN